MALIVWFSGFAFMCGVGFEGTRDLARDLATLCPYGQRQDSLFRVKLALRKGLGFRVRVLSKRRVVFIGLPFGLGECKPEVVIWASCFKG